MSNRFQIRTVCVTLILLLPVVSARADKEPEFTWSEVSEADWSIRDDSAYTESDAVMLFEKVTMDDRKVQDKKSYRTIYRRIRILSDAGRSWADVAAPFVALNQEIKDVRGRTLLPDGAIIPLEPDQVFEKTVVKTKGEEFKQRTFSLPSVTDDCIIEYMIKYFTPGYVPQWIIQKDIPLLKAECRWYIAEIGVHYLLSDFIDEIAANAAPNWIWLNTGTARDVTKLPTPEAATELVFETADVPAFESEPHGLPDSFLRSKLLFYYGTTTSPTSYWGERSISVARSVVRFCKKNKRLKKIVESFGDLESDEEKTRAAFEWVQDSITNVTYVDLYEYKDGKKKKKKEPKYTETIDDVIKRRYGWSRDIDYLFWSMLKEMGIEAKIAKAKARFDDLFVRQAKYWQFDRTLVAVPVGVDKYKFYAPGQPCTPIDHVPWFCEGVEVLMADADRYISVVPFSRPAQSTIKRSYTLNIAESLEMEGSVTSETTGHISRSLRITAFDEPVDEIEKLLRDELSDELCNAELDSLQFKHLEDVNQPLIMDANLQFPDLTDIGGRILLKPFDFLTCGENPFHAVERRGSLLFPFAYELEESASFTLPSGWEIEALPSDTSYTNLAGNCAVSYANVDGTLKLTCSFVLTSPFWYPDDYLYIKRLFQSRQDQANSIVVLAKK